jgi:hypothetical protein
VLLNFLWLVYDFRSEMRTGLTDRPEFIPPTPPAVISYMMYDVRGVLMLLDLCSLAVSRIYCTLYTLVIDVVYINAATNS